MKGIKACIIATIITAIIICSCACAIPAGAEAERPEFYPKLTIVTNAQQLSDGSWLVTCHDQDGQDWAFYDDENTWKIGDLANCLMWTVGNTEETDEIIEVYFEGHTEDIDSFFQMFGWH